MKALEILGKAWEDESLEMQGKTRRDMPSSIGEKAENINSVGMSDVWDGAKEGTTENAQSFMRMLSNTK